MSKRILWAGYQGAFKLLRQSLSAASGHWVDASRDATETLEAVAQLDYGLIIVENKIEFGRLPRQEHVGREDYDLIAFGLVKYLRENERYKSTPIVLRHSKSSTPERMRFFHDRFRNAGVTELLYARRYGNPKSFAQYLKNRYHLA